MRTTKSMKFLKEAGLTLIATLPLTILPLLASGEVITTNIQVNLVRVPDGGLQPQALVDSTGTVHLVYLAGDPKHCNVFYARRPVGQTKFFNAIRVNSAPDSAVAVGTVRGAQLALGKSGRVHVAWNGSDRASTSSNGSFPMLYSRMNDAGDAFEPQRDLMTSTTHLDGGGSVAADPYGHVYVVWQGHKRTGPQEEIDRGVYLAFSSDDGRTFTPERQVNSSDTGACGCCGLKAFANNDGSLAILFRSANLAGNRDSVLLLSTNYGVTFSSTVVGQWHFSSCPMSTYALGVTRGRFIGLWETAGQIYSAWLGPDKPGTNPTAVNGATGKRKHPAFAATENPSGPMLIAWTEGTGWEKGGTLSWECVDAQGAEIVSGRSEGVPVWGSVAAIAERNGTFTVIY